MDESAARDQVRRMVSSRVFQNSERLRRMLSFIVEQTLQGAKKSLKEYTIAVEVYDRGDAFDPRADAIVRVEAIRLRKKLQRYYQTDGASDPIIIALPKGGYVPQFHQRP